MSKEIVKLQEKKDWLTKDEKNIIRKQFFPAGATDIEMQYCMKVAESLNLNPILNQIYFVPRKSNVNGKWVEKIEPLAGRDSFLLLAHKSGEFESLESSVEIVDKPEFINDEWQTVKELSATAIVHKIGMEKTFSVTVYYSEYIQYKKDGTPTKFWNDKPITMLKKVAESQVLRKAFNITGLYHESEISTNFNKQVADSKMKIKKGANTIDIEAEEIYSQREIVEAPEKKSNLKGVAHYAPLGEKQIEKQKENEGKDKPGF